MLYYTLFKSQYLKKYVIQDNVVGDSHPFP